MESGMKSIDVGTHGVHMMPGGIFDEGEFFCKFPFSNVKISDIILQVCRTHSGYGVAW